MNEVITSDARFFKNEKDNDIVITCSVTSDTVETGIHGPDSSITMTLTHKEASIWSGHIGSLLRRHNQKVKELKHD